MRLTFVGASGTVTGSQYLLECGGSRILIDCGLFQGYKQLRLRNWSRPPYEPRAIDAVVLTHAHIDHSGFLPRLAAQGFSRTIYSTQGTRELCRVLLPDSGRLHEEDAAFANRHGFSKHKPALPLYTEQQAEACLSQFRGVDFRQSVEVAKNIYVEFCPAGHLLGAASVRVSTREGTITFTGDLGRPNDPVMKPPDTPGPCDYLVVESTYGDRIHPPIDPEQELLDWLKPACERKGVIVIPAFAVGRTQTLLLMLARLRARNALPDLPIFMDSPMAIDATQLYRKFADEHRIDAEECRRMCSAAQITTTPEASKALDSGAGPKIILSASGMATGGRVVHHLKAFVGDKRNLILLAGFQAGGTRGAALLAGAEKIRIHGEEFPVRAQVGQLQASSSHADANELLAWMGKLPNTPKAVFVTHGEPAASDALRLRIEHELRWPAFVPESRSVHQLFDGFPP
ncbi:MAG: mRNA 3-end processing factor [Steroidobacteraceae bacterium]|jgi:metallo-beta-lactamase family protein|nr:mRNA 3-end processing factor [Steroidobacteraceae bacterium]